MPYSVRPRPAVLHAASALLKPRRPLGPRPAGPPVMQPSTHGVIPQPGGYTLQPNTGPFQHTHGAGYPPPSGPAKPKPPSKPKPPPAPTPTPLPVDPIYDQTLDLIRRQQAGADADVLYQQQQAELGYVDPSNPFSRAALLERSFQQSQNATNNSMAARGQLYAGATQNAQNQNAFGFQQGWDQNQRAYQGVLYDLQQRRAASGQSAEESRIAAFGERVARALAARPDAVPAPYKPPVVKKPPHKKNPYAIKPSTKPGVSQGQVSGHSQGPYPKPKHHKKKHHKPKHHL